MLSHHTPSGRRPLLPLCALALTLVLLLSGCGSFVPAAYTKDRLDMVPFGKMPYYRPDLDALEKLFASVTAEADAAGPSDSKRLAKRLQQCWNAYHYYYTLENLAMLRSDIDQTDEKWADEYEFCLTNEVRLEQWLDSLLLACAASEAEVDPSMLAGYDQEDATPYSDRLLELMEQEGNLLRDYWRAMMRDEIELDGQTVSYTDYIADPEISYEDYQTANLAYYRACNAEAAPIYIDLIKVRRAMAEEFGFDSYEAYQYASFSRDYTPAQARRYLDDLAGAVAGAYRSFLDRTPYDTIDYGSLSREELLSLLDEATEDMGQIVEEAFSFMEQYRLYDVSATGKKAPGAYTIYLSSYDAPFCYLGAYGDWEDFLNMAHEFGHFADAYCNYDATTSLDLSELYSQAMANLALLKSRELVSEDRYRSMLLLHLLATLKVYTDQAAYGDFESRAYRLSDEELTVENLNDLSLSCARRFGVDAAADEEVCALYWTQVNHLFESPFYVISYCVSADAAIQIVARERSDPGAGIACYEDILDWQEDVFLSEVQRVGLESPFAPGRVAENLALLEELMGAAFDALPGAA